MWHAEAYQLMGITAAVDPGLVQALEQRGRETGWRMPDAVREWFSVPGAAEWLQARAANLPVRRADLGLPVEGIDYLSRGHLALDTDSQWCCRWVVRLLPPLGGVAQPPADDPIANDPPVDLVDPEDTDQLTSIYARHFTTYILTSVWDALLPDDDRSAVAFDHLLSETALPQLRRELRCLPTTFSWAGNQQCEAMFRFDGDARVLVAVMNDMALFSCVASEDASRRRQLQQLLGVPVGRSRRRR